MNIVAKRKEQRAAIKRMDLATRTNLFWQIQQANNGRGPLQGITTEKAIGYLYDLIEATPEKILHERLWDLRERIVGKRTKPGSSAPATSTTPMFPDDDGPRAA